MMSYLSLDICYAGKVLQLHLNVQMLDLALNTGSLQVHKRVVHNLCTSITKNTHYYRTLIKSG